MDVFFSEDEMDSLMSVGNARNEYQAVARPGKTPETNLAVGDTITVHLKDRKIDRAVVRGKASGEYHMEVAVNDTAAARAERIKYRAPRIEFEVPEDRIILDDGRELDYRESRSLAGGGVRQPEAGAGGERQSADRRSRRPGRRPPHDLRPRVTAGHDLQGRDRPTSAGSTTASASARSATNELDVQSGSYSTCSLDQPHYHFRRAG
jgi:hypothetical protein